MERLRQIAATPWKVWNEFERGLAYPRARLTFAYNGIVWGKNWRLYGVPIVQKHRHSTIYIGAGLQLRSTWRSNPLSPHHPVVIGTWQAGARLTIGDNFGMTGGTLCAAQAIVIGHNVAVGANTTIIDTDFHWLSFEARRIDPAGAKTAPVVIEDDVFIGMSCIILKGVTIGRGSIIGAGSVVTRTVPPGSLVAGNPARIVRSLNEMG
jgi:acetyltransferase-like isoleucine patch superfamily enzyme